MRARVLLAALGAALVAAGCDGGPAPAGKASAQPIVTGRFELGVQTHFGQDWPVGRVATASSLGAPVLRDGLSWQGTEKTPGQILFEGRRVDALDRACASGMRLVMTVVPRNRAYDAGQVPTSARSRDAFATWLSALAERFGPCLMAVEIGNEINNSRALPVPAGMDRATAYVRLMQAVYPRFKRRHPRVAVLGGSTNAIGTGFLDKLFAAGLLDVADGIAVHPYRNHGENIGWEIARLNAVMARHGRVLPVWATEFGDTFERPEDAASALVKMTTLMSGAGVRMASWYALSDQKWFPGMGLVEAGGRPKPAAGAFSFLQRELLPHGRPVDVSADRLNPVWRYGRDRWVVWGAPRELRLASGSRAFDAAGRAIRGTVRVGASPVVIIGPRPELLERAVLADSLMEFGSAPWSYHAQGRTGRESALVPVDTDYASSLGDRALRPLRLDWSGGAVGPEGTGPVLRYTAPSDMRASLLACFARSRGGRDLAVAVEGPGGRELGRATLGANASVSVPEVALRRGQALSVRVIGGPATGAAAGEGGRGFRYRVMLYRPGDLPPACPAQLAGWSDA